MPVKRKMEQQITSAEHGITQHEQARMALKLLVNYGKSKEEKIQKRIKEREQITKQNASFAKKLAMQVGSPKSDRALNSPQSWRKRT